MESLHVYRMLTEVRNIDAGPMRFYYVVGWGIPPSSQVSMRRAATPGRDLPDIAVALQRPGAGGELSGLLLGTQHPPLLTGV